MAEPINFTKRSLDALKPPTDGRDRYHVRDTKQAGLIITVTSAGGKVFYLYKKIHGQADRIRLGRFDEITIEQARTLAKRHIADIADGQNPKEKRNTLRKTPTLLDVWDHYVETHAEVHNRPKTRTEDKRIFDKHFNTWKPRRISTLDTPDIAALHARIGKKHPYMANRALELIKKLFNHATRMQRWSKSNPCNGVRRFKEQSRERVLNGDEIAILWKALGDEESDLFRDLFRVLLLTGARRGNVQAMAWSDIDLDAGVWRIAASEAKAGENLSVVLSVEVVAIIRDRRELTNGSPWVFPSWGKTGHVTEVKSAWRRIVKRSGLEDVRPHDLRRTLGSWQAALGTSLPVIGRSLGHKKAASTEIYARIDLDPVRESVGAATAKMLEAATPTIKAKDGTQVIDTEGKSDA